MRSGEKLLLSSSSSSKSEEKVAVSSSRATLNRENEVGLKSLVEKEEEDKDKDKVGVKILGKTETKFKFEELGVLGVSERKWSEDVVVVETDILRIERDKDWERWER